MNPVEDKPRCPRHFTNWLRGVWPWFSSRQVYKYYVHHARTPVRSIRTPSQWFQGKHSAEVTWQERWSYISIYCQGYGCPTPFIVYFWEQNLSLQNGRACIIYPVCKVCPRSSWFGSFICGFEFLRFINIYRYLNRLYTFFYVERFFFRYTRINFAMISHLYLSLSSVSPTHTVRLHRFIRTFRHLTKSNKTVLIRRYNETQEIIYR